MKVGIFFILLTIAGYLMQMHLICNPQALTFETTSFYSDEVQKLTASLYSHSKSERLKVKDKLLTLAKNSDTRRSEIIQALIKILEDIVSSRRSENTWYDATNLLGELKAVEAIDILVKHLDFNNGIVGLSLGHWPSVRAVVKIGMPAIPKLVESLHAGPPSIRENAARALGLIRGEQAKGALEKALLTETDEVVRRYIQNALSNINKKAPNK